MRNLDPRFLLGLALGLALPACSGDGNNPGPDAGALDAALDTSAPDVASADAPARDVPAMRDANATDVTPVDTGTMVDSGPPAPAACLPPALIDLDAVGTRQGNVITYTGSNAAASATSELAAPSCQSTPGHMVVLSHRMQTTARLRADTNSSGTDFDTVLWALDRCAPAGATELGCGDDINVAPRETASLFVTDAPVPAGTTVFLVVAGYDTAVGNFALTVSELATVSMGGACDPAGVQNECAAGLVCQDATGMGSGTTCSPPAYGESELDGATWRDACAMGMRLDLTAASGTDPLDDGHPAAGVPVPFAFRFFARNVSALWPSTNGYAVFDAMPSDSHGGDLYLPEPTEGAVVAPLWQDLALHPAASGMGAICAGTFGSNPDREFVIEWQDAMPSGSTTAHVTFELVLHERTGLIDYLYSQMDPGMSPEEETSGSWASIGLQAGGSDSRYALHTGDVSTMYGIRWTPAP